MNHYKYIAILFVFLFAISCESNDDDTETLSGDCEVCTYTPNSGETAGTAPSALEGTYNVTLDFVTSASPFPQGTKATFTLDDNVLTVAIEGQDCITLENPIATGTSEWTFVDNCRDNYIYGISQNQNGGLNEINFGTTDFQFLGQFTE